MPGGGRAGLWDTGHGTSGALGAAAGGRKVLHPEGRGPGVEQGGIGGELDTDVPVLHGGVYRAGGERGSGTDQEAGGGRGPARRRDVADTPGAGGAVRVMPVQGQVTMFHGRVSSPART